MSPVNPEMPKPAPQLHDPIGVELELTDLAEQANRHHSQATGHIKDAMSDYRAAGNAVRAAKLILPHGKFEKWVAEQCEFSKSTAHRYMLVAENWETVEELLNSSDDPAQASLRGIECHIRQSRSADQEAKTNETNETNDETDIVLNADLDTGEFPQNQSVAVPQLCDQFHKTKRVVAAFRAQTKLSIGDGQSGPDAKELTAVIGGPLNELIEELEGLGRQLAIFPAPSSPLPPAAGKSQPSPKPTATPSQAEKRSPRNSRPVEPHSPSPYSSLR